MRDEFLGRVDELGDLCRELSTHVQEGRWRHAAELASALELDLDELQGRLRTQHKIGLRAARAANRKETVNRLRAGLGKGRLRRWKAQREAWIDRADQIESTPDT